MVQGYKADTESTGADSQPVSRFGALRRRLASDRGIWRRGIILALCSVLLTLLMVLHADVPNTIGNLGSLIETFLPWFGLMMPVLLVLGLLRRSATAVIALVLLTAVWLNLFGGLLFSDKSGTGGDLTVATHNVNAGNPDPAGTARQVSRLGCGRRRPAGTAHRQGVGLRGRARRALPAPLRAGHRRAVEQVPRV